MGSSKVDTSIPTAFSLISALETFSGPSRFSLSYFYNQALYILLCE